MVLIDNNLSYLSDYGTFLGGWNWKKGWKGVQFFRALDKPATIFRKHFPIDINVSFEGSKREGPRSAFRYLSISLQVLYRESCKKRLYGSKF